MNVQFRNADGLISPPLQERIERKLAKLSLLTDTPQSSAIATFDVEKAVGSHQSGELWQASVTIVGDGAQYHAAALADSPEKATTKVLKEIRREVKSKQGRDRTLMRKGGGLFKSFTQRFSRDT